jgi:ribose 5-phosphate isomerase A
VSDTALTPPFVAILAAHALAYVRPGQVIGLGSGEAATAFVHALGREVRAGLSVTGVPTSEATATLARELGIRLASLEDSPSIDVTVDGADEVDAGLDLIKGYGGALVREKVVAAASRRLVILVGRDKLVPVLGSRGKLPIEVVPSRPGSVAGDSLRKATHRYCA